MAMLMQYKPEQVKNSDGTLAPWWKIKIYKNGNLFDESPTQYSSKSYVWKLCIRANIRARFQYFEDRIFGVK